MPHNHGATMSFHFLHSKVSKSENRAKLYLAYKDHKKEKEKTRPIGTGNSSNTRAFANSVSDLLESVANSEEEKFEVISTEDMLHSVGDHNRAVEKRNKDMKDKKMRKEKCHNHKLWKMRCRECRRRRRRAQDTWSNSDSDVSDEEENTPRDTPTEIIQELINEIIEDAEELGYTEVKMSVEDCHQCKERATESMKKD